MASSRIRTNDQLAQRRALEGRRPDTGDIAEAADANWRPARRGACEVRKEAISLRVAIDVLEWLRRQGPDDQTTINRILRERMQAEGSSVLSMRLVYPVDGIDSAFISA